MSPTHMVPTPPAFLDPLTEIDSSYYYAVPKFFGQNHPNTRWLIAMIRASEDDRLKHKMETSPGAFKGVYYQLMDHPQLYIPEDVSAASMFKRQAVVYLSPLGMAIYLGNISLAELMLGYKDVYDDPLCDPCEPQYATHLQDNELGDFHAFPPSLVMMRRLVFGCAQPLMKAGWDISKPVAMPMRRKFERRVLYFRDWLEVSLAILAARPLFPLQVLLREMTQGHIYKPLKMTMAKFLPNDPAKAEAFGLINVDQLPPGVQMVGVRSLLEMAEQYDRFLQMRDCARKVAALKREATAVGLNPEILMIQAQDFDAGALPPPEQTDGSNSVAIRRSANNSSVADDLAVYGSQPRHIVLNVNMSAAKGKSKVDPDPPYASEGCRILHYALMRDPLGKSMQVCIESFCVLLRRGFFLTPHKLEPASSPARDVRNTATLLLNLIQREQNKVDKIVDKIRLGYKRFAHLEEHKQLENRKIACVLYMNKLVGILNKLLLQSKSLVDFVQAEFPPFVPSSTNFSINPYLAQKFKDIKFGVIREFNACKDAWIYLDKEMLRAVNGIDEMQLHFKVGKKPTSFPKPTSGKGNGKGKGKNKNNMSNTNSCFVSYTRVQRRPKPSIASTATKTLSAAASNALAAAYASSITMSSGQLLAGDGSSSIGLPIDTSADSISSETDDLPELPDLDEIDADFQLLMTPVTAAAVAAADSTDSNKSQGSSCQTQDHSSSHMQLQQSAGTPRKSAVAAAEGDSPSRQSTDMEKLLASLCREVDSLFKPLGAASNIDQRWSAPLDELPSAAAGTISRSALPGWATLSSEGAAAAGLNEYSTIEPELAPTPMPTPEASPAPETIGTADVASDADIVPAADSKDRPSCSSQPIGPQRRKRPAVTGQMLPPVLRMKLKERGVLRLLGRLNPRVTDVGTRDIKNGK